jgi:phage baseplate assembly protein W
MSYNKTSEFYASVPGSNYQLKDIDSSINGYGDLTELFDVDVIVNSINKILRINRGTYLDDPQFGLGLEKYLFEPSDRITQEAITQDVRHAIASYEKRARIAVEVAFYSDMKGFEIKIFIEKDGVKKETRVKVTENLIKNL